MENGNNKNRQFKACCSYPCGKNIHADLVYKLTCPEKKRMTEG